MYKGFKINIPSKQSSIIKVIGVGGGGSNAVNYMYEQGIVGVDFYICNTDSQHLEKSAVPNKIHLGHTLTEGRGAGSNPDMGRQCALESIDRITEILRDNTKMVFVTAGMGGGTGTGAAPVIAKVAKELGILTVGIVTTPFDDEGPIRTGQADAGLEEMRPHVDALLVISNNSISEMYEELRYSEAFAKADDILCTAAKGIAEIITKAGQMNVDFEDVKTAMTDSGKAIMGNGTGAGENRATDAARIALESPLLDETKIVGATHLLVNIAYGDEEPYMRETKTIIQYLQNQAGKTANLKFGICQDETLGDELSVTVIATGFKNIFSTGDNAVDDADVEFVINETENVEDKIMDEHKQVSLNFEERERKREKLEAQPISKRNQPAYKRRNIVLEENPKDAVKYDLFNVSTDTSDPDIVSGNSYLHNKPD